MSSTRTLDVNMPSTTSMSRATNFPSQIDGFENYCDRRSINQSNYMCQVVCLMNTTSTGLYLRGILDNVYRISATVSSLSSFISLNTLGKDTSEGSVLRALTTTAKVWYMSSGGGAIGVSACPLTSRSPSRFPPGGSGLPHCPSTPPEVLAIPTSDFYLVSGDSRILPWPTCSHCTTYSSGGRGSCTPASASSVWMAVSVYVSVTSDDVSLPNRNAWSLANRIWVP